MEARLYQFSQNLLKDDDLVDMGWLAVSSVATITHVELRWRTIQALANYSNLGLDHIHSGHWWFQNLPFSQEPFFPPD